MIWFLSRLVEDRVGLDHVVHHVALRNLFGAELERSGQVLSVIVAQVVVTDDGHGFDSRTDQEIHQHRLELGLARFEIVTANHDIVFLSKLDDPWCLKYTLVSYGLKSMMPIYTGPL